MVQRALIPISWSCAAPPLGCSGSESQNDPARLMRFASEHLSHAAICRFIIYYVSMSKITPSRLVNSYCSMSCDYLISVDISVLRSCSSKILSWQHHRDYCKRINKPKPAGTTVHPKNALKKPPGNSTKHCRYMVHQINVPCC